VKITDTKSVHREGKAMNKIEMSLARIKEFEPMALMNDMAGYYVCISGGKDSSVIQEICIMATDIEALKSKTAIPIFSGLPMRSFTGIPIPPQPRETSPHEVSLEVIGKKPVRVNLDKPENDNQLSGFNRHTRK
jgi:hypothetical protein